MSDTGTHMPGMTEPPCRCRFRTHSVTGLRLGLASRSPVMALQMHGIHEILYGHIGGKRMPVRPGPFEVNARRSPAASARRQRFADIRLTGKRFATRAVADLRIEQLSRGQPHPLTPRHSSAVSPSIGKFLMTPA